MAQVLEREATAARAARAAGGAVADVDDGAAPSSSTPAAQKSHVVSGYLMKRPPRVVGRRMSSAVPSWTWSDGAASPALCGVEPEAAAHEEAVAVFVVDAEDPAVLHLLLLADAGAARDVDRQAIFQNQTVAA